jgi:hypothetical protein
MTQPQPITPKDDDELKAFLLVFRQGLRLVTAYIEKKYDIPCKCETCEKQRQNRAA